MLGVPEGVAVTSSDMIANLSEHLIAVLDELDAKDKIIAKLDDDVNVSLEIIYHTVLYYTILYHTILHT